MESTMEDIHRLENKLARLAQRVQELEGLAQPQFLWLGLVTKVDRDRDSVHVEFGLRGSPTADWFPVFSHSGGAFPREGERVLVLIVPFLGDLVIPIKQGHTSLADGNWMVGGRPRGTIANMGASDA